jgi:hypothetical protein
MQPAGKYFLSEPDTKLRMPRSSLVQFDLAEAWKYPAVDSIQEKGK